MSHRRRMLCFLLLFLLACFIRLAYIFVNGTYLEPGAAEMVRAAVSLAENGTLGNVYAPDSGPSAHVAPLYPFLLSLIYRLFGSESWSGRLAQELLGAGMTCAGITLLPAIAQRSRLATGSGWVAAVVLAVLPVNLWVETSGAWEQPAAALLLLAILWTAIVLHDRQWRSPWLALLFGTWTGLVALLSPALAPAVAILLAGEFLANPLSRTAIIRTLPMLVVPIVLCVVPWMVRNHRVLGGWVMLRSNFGLELWIGNHPGATGRTFDTAWDDPSSFIFENHPYLSRQQQQTLREVGELNYMKAKQRQAIEWIQAHPGEFLKLCLKRFRLFWFPPPDLWTNARYVCLLKAFVYNLFALGMFAELACLFATRHPFRYLWLGALLGPSLIYLVTHVDGRYRYPVFALSALACCSFGARLLQWLRNHAVPLMRSARRGPPLPPASSGE